MPRSLASRRDRRQALRNTFRALEHGDRIRIGLAVDDMGLIAALATDSLGYPIYVERRNLDADAGYRALVLKHHRSQTPTHDPHKLARGELLTEKLTACTAFVIDLSTEMLQSRTSPQAATRAVVETFRPTLQQGDRLVVKQATRSANQLLSLYQRHFQEQRR